jgi:hypothetical protein
MNSGVIPFLVPDTTGLTVSSHPSGTANMTVVPLPGNEISGTFRLTFTRTDGGHNTTGPIPFDATAADVQTALTSLWDAVRKDFVIPKGAISVTRSGPDGQKGYGWSVSFLTDFYRTFYGPQSLFVADKTGLQGSRAAPAVTIAKVRPGTIQEVQKITVTSGSSINSTMAMRLTFNGQQTDPVLIRPTGGVCNSQIVEVQTITSTTVDNSQFGGIFDVSMYTQFRLFYGNYATSWIDANPTGSTDCSQSATQIKTALQTLDAFHTVAVTGISTSSAQTCKWTVSFVSSIGDVKPLIVQTRNQVSTQMGDITAVSRAGADTITIGQITNGQKDAITAALEALNNVGTVTVTPVSNTQGANGQCSWLVTFDSNAGNLPLMTVTVYNAPNGVSHSTTAASAALAGVTVAITEITPGTASTISGNFALSFMGERSVYVPYNADARTVQNILEELTTIGKVTVERSSVDENNGYTWTVTFLTNLGSLPLIQFDNSDMKGTVVRGLVRKEVGFFVTLHVPRFNDFLFSLLSSPFLFFRLLVLLHHLIHLIREVNYLLVLSSLPIWITLKQLLLDWIKELRIISVLQPLTQLDKDRFLILRFLTPFLSHKDLQFQPMLFLNILMDKV